MTTAEPGRRPEGQRNPENRDRILLAGLAEFAAVGYEGASISAIAARSGLNKQLIYHYYGSKQGLYDAVLRMMLEQTLPGVSAGMAGVLSSALDFEHAGEWVRLLGWEGLSYDGGAITFERERREKFGLIRADLERLQREGRLDPRVDPRFATLLVSLAIIAPPILPQLTRLITGEDGDSPDVRRHMVSLLAVLLGVKPPAGGDPP